MENTARPLAVITGASNGIGYELAQVFAKNNFDLVVTAEDGGIVEAAEAFRVFGGLVEHVQTNLASFKGVDALFQKIKSLNRAIDTVVFNAEIGTNGEFQNIPMDEELNLIQLNITSTVHLAKHIVKEMIPQGHGRLLFTSSIAAKIPGSHHAVYTASKAFVHTFAEALRLELKKSGITVMHTNTDVALKGFEALMAGKDHIATGFKNNFTSI